MLKIGGLLAGLSLLCAAPAGADDATEAKAVVEKAVKALGGKDKLAKLPATTFTFKGTVEEGGQKAEFSGNWSVLLPDKYHAELTMMMGPRTEMATLVANGDKVWAHEASRNKTEEAPEDALVVVRTVLTTVHLAHNPTPLLGKEYELAPLKEAKADGKAAVGVKVKHKGLPDIDLYFDKETSLPIKADVTFKEDRNAEEKQHSFLFKDYKEADGVKHFTKLVLRRDDKDMMVMELSDVKRQEKLDEKLFEKP